MPEFPVRRITTRIEKTLHEDGAACAEPRLRRAIMAACRNPLAGTDAPDPQPATGDLKPLGLMLSDRLIAALGGRDGIDGYGKGEHGALWHVPGGYTLRERLGESRAIVPSAMKVAPMGGSLDVPMGHINAAYVRSHFDAITVQVPDAPRADEIVLVPAMAKGPRVPSRMGGLEVWQLRGEGALR
ncbi:MAG: amino acid synthesis family protein [Paracoccaceae bacterium]